MTCRHVSGPMRAPDGLEPDAQAVTLGQDETKVADRALSPPFSRGVRPVEPDRPVGAIAERRQPSIAPPLRPNPAGVSSVDLRDIGIARFEPGGRGR